MEKYRLTSISATKTLAETLAKSARIGDVFFLKGDLGSGKTTFARFFINSFFDKEQEVTSPTFNILQLYEAPEFTIWHFDLYRLKNISEVAELGIDEAFTSGVSLIEWPEIAESLLPKNRIEVNLSYDGEFRTASVEIISA